MIRAPWSWQNRPTLQAAPGVPSCRQHQLISTTCVINPLVTAGVISHECDYFVMNVFTS